MDASSKLVDTSMIGKRFIETFTECRNIVSVLMWRAMAPMGIGRAQVSLLLALGRYGPSTVSTLAGRTGIDPSAAARSFTLLSRQGWIRRRRGEQDRRESYIELTPSGQRLRRKVDAIYARVGEQLEQYLDALDLADLERIASKLAPLATEPVAAPAVAASRAPRAKQPARKPRR